MANTLFLRLEGPMQSWGERARWSVRDTANEPTKSGIVGLLACAMGLNTDEQLINLSRSIRIGVRCDRPGMILRDYHTIIGGVVSAEGKIKVNAKTKLPETLVSTRFYLADASFLVAVQSEDANVERLALSVQDPIWPYFLGRKSCPPAAPIFAGLGDFPSLENALQHYQPYLKDDLEGELLSLRSVIECTAAQANAIRRRDEIGSHRQRTFYPRYIYETLLDIPEKTKEA